MNTTNFTLYNEETKNNLAGLTYLPPGNINPTKIVNDTPYHFLLVHATGFCKEVYIDLVKSLRKKGINSPITSIDCLNHGDSTHGLPDCDWRLCAKDAYAVIERVIRPRDPNKIIIGIGHSMGGAVVTLVEAAHPGTFGGLVLFEPILPPPPYEKSPTHFLAELTVRRKAVFPDKETLITSYRKKPPFNAFTEGALIEYVEHGFKKAVIDGKEVVTLKSPPQEEAEFYRNSTLQDGYDKIQKIRTPFVISRGTTSETFTNEYYADIAAKTKSGKFTSIAGSHFFPMEAPDACANLIASFLDERVKVGLKAKL